MGWTRNAIDHIGLEDDLHVLLGPIGWSGAKGRGQILWPRNDFPRRLAPRPRDAGYGKQDLPGLGIDEPGHNAKIFRDLRAAGRSGP